MWRVPVEELRIRLAGGNHEFLRHLDYNSLDAREALRLGPEAPYYLSVVYRGLGMPEMERRMLEVGRRRGPPLWRDESELRALEMDLDSGAAAEVLRRATALGGRVTDTGRASRLRRIRLDALYDLDRGRELLDLLDTHLALAPDAAALEREDPELSFYRAVGSALAEEPEWEELFRGLAWNLRAGSIHARALAFLERDPRRLMLFNAAELELFRAKAALGEGRQASASVLLASALPLLVPPAGSVVVEEVGRLYLALGEPREGLSLLDSLPAMPDEWVREEFRGRLYRAGGVRGEAALALERSYRGSQDPGQRQRALWHYLDLKIQSGETNLGRLFWNRREYVTDGAYFEDILEDAATALVAARGWTEIETLRDFARETHVTSTLSRLDFILARAVTAGLLSRTPSRDPELLLQEAVAADPMGYHALLAAYLTGQPYTRLGCEAAASDAADVSAALAEPGTGTTAPAVPELIEGYFRYGLPIQGYRAVVALGDAVPLETVLAAARELQATGHYEESIRLAATVAGRSATCPDRRLLQLSYPALYVSDVERLALAQELPVRAVLALVREESAFEAAAVSRVGAVGLTQLMPATAEEVARRLGLVGADLKDPITNLTIGLRHLAGLRKNTTGMARTVMAYNAGLSRLKSWEREYGRLPDELFAEAVPYDETRMYARRILVGAVLYGALYDGAPPAETIELFFPALAPLSLASIGP